jgi:CDP-2,3-bis-(O-geranylgeranyl)-sn-glycerol synthase
VIEILKYLWLLLPASVANMIPPFAAIIWPKWNQPIDMGLKFRGKRLLGDHKTVRGLITGTVAGLLVFYLQRNIFHNYSLGLELFDYSALPVYTGFLLSFGALFGDAIKSFFKRQVGAAEGKPWFPWDQIDWIIGMIGGLCLVKAITIMQAGIIVGLGLGLHMAGKVVGYMIRVNKSVI